jgi:hypothetical protein
LQPPPEGGTFQREKPLWKQPSIISLRSYTPSTRSDTAAPEPTRSAITKSRSKWSVSETKKHATVLVTISFNHSPGPVWLMRTCASWNVVIPTHLFRSVPYRLRWSYVSNRNQRWRRYLHVYQHQRIDLLDEPIRFIGALVQRQSLPETPDVDHPRYQRAHRDLRSVRSGRWASEKPIMPS